MLVEFLNSSVQLCALLALNKELCDLRAALEILGLDFAHLAFDSFLLSLPTTLTLRFALRRSKSVFGELSPMLRKCRPSLEMPSLTFILWETLPRHTDNLGQGRMVRLDLRRHVLALDERRTEEDECIGGTGDVVFRFLLRMRSPSGAGRAVVVVVWRVNLELGCNWRIDQWWRFVCSERLGGRTK